MNPENLTHYGYGDEFDSITEINNAIEKRIEEGVVNLTGSAILWSQKEGEKYPDRIGIRILEDGSISFAHAEDL